MKDRSRLLIIDDDPAVGQTIIAIARDISMDVLSVTHPDGFFQAMERWDPTHVVLDLLMPGVSGMEVIGELGERGCGAKIIIISGAGGGTLDAATSEVEAQGLRLHGTLTKPFRPSVLRDLLRS